MKRQNIRGLVCDALRTPLFYRAKHELDKRGYLCIYQHRPADALPPDPVDLWYLYRIVRKHKPKTIIEFGSGCSTVILALALLENAESGSKRGFLYSLDVDEHWAAVTRKSMPNSVAGLYEIRHAPVDIVDDGGTPVFRDRNVPQVPVDMIYLDGPPLTRDVKVAIDPVDLMSLFEPGLVLCVDGRKENVRFLRERMQVYNWRFKFDPNPVIGTPTFYRVA